LDRKLEHKLFRSEWWLCIWQSVVK